MADTEPETIVKATRAISASAERIFELIAEPSSQPSWDGNNNLASSAPGQRVHGVGDVFKTTLTNGAVRENHVVEFIEGSKIASCPAAPGKPRRGYHVVLVARSADRLEELARRLGPQAHPLPADLSDRSARAGLPDRVAALGLTPDILINNAGLSTLGLVAKSVPEQEVNLVEVDVAAVVDLCSRFLPGMVDRRRGAVLNVASIAGMGPLPGQAAYGAAKAFVL